MQIDSGKSNSQLESFRPGNSTTPMQISQESELRLSENISTKAKEDKSTLHKRATTESTGRVQQSRRKSRVKQPILMSKKVMINTHEVFVKTDKCPFPDGYIQPTQSLRSRKTSH